MSLLSRVLRILGVDDLPDPNWRATGFRYTQPGPDEFSAALSAARNEALADRRRKLAAERSQPPKGQP
jgi:hypothetical protein